MFKINSCFIAIFGVISVLLISGCQNFLEENDPSNFNVNNYFTKPAHATAAVNAIYTSMYPMHDQQAWLITELRTGMFNSTFSANGGFPSFRIVRDLAMSADHPSLQVFWDSHYRGIANANVSIHEIPRISMNESEKDNLLGEARFLRAYYYFNLVRIFGEVPLITKNVELDDPQLTPERASIEEIYSLIIDDLIAAENSGLPFSDKTGRVSVGAVKSMLAEVYLTMAGFPLQKGMEYFTLARDKAKEVIDSDQFYLFDSYDAFRTESMDNTGEYIFEIQFNEIDKPSNSLQIGLVPFKLGVSAYSSEQGFVFAQPEFVHSFEKGDIRGTEKQFFYSQFTSESNRSDTVNLGQYYVYKFFDENAHLNTARSGLNWPVIRYADVLLDFAEASNEINGVTAEAINAVNAIRSRANLPYLEQSITQSEFRDAILKERWYENCFEFKNWFDMIRLRKALNYGDGSVVDYIGYTFPGGKTIQEKHLLFPIPTPELRNNPNLTQNNGY